MSPRPVMLVMLLLGCTACTKRDAPTQPKQDAENAVIDDALNAQLEALGYFKNTKRPEVASKKDDPYENVDIGHFFDGIDGTFVFDDVKRNRRLIYNEERANKQFSPQSTFKIPNTLIALESGVADSPETAIPWDPQQYPKEPWWDEVLKPMGLLWDRDHTLKSAFENSCVWCYRTLAKKIGKETMKTHLNAFDYGNKDISHGVDGFWLDSTLRISAVEQVDFLKKFVNNTLPISQKTRSAALEVFERERKEGAVLYAKTGGGAAIGWFVGFIVNGNRSYVFAFNMAGDFKETAQKRVSISINILQELGVWL